MQLKPVIFSLLLTTLPFIGNMAQAAEAPAAKSASEQVEPAKININTATAEQLTSLKGIGKKKAEAIIAWRESHGPFKDVSQLVEVKGIGDKFINEHLSQLTVD